MKTKTERELCLQDVAEGLYLDYAHAKMATPLSEAAFSLCNLLDDFGKNSVLAPSINNNSVVEIKAYIKAAKEFVKQTKAFQKKRKSKPALTKKKQKKEAGASYFT